MMQNVKKMKMSEGEPALADKSPNLGTMMHHFSTQTEKCFNVARFAIRAIRLFLGAARLARFAIQSTLRPWAEPLRWQLPAHLLRRLRRRS
jgi:hypothetical protein